MPNIIYNNSLTSRLDGVSRRSFLKGLGATAIVASLPTGNAQAFIPLVPGLISGFKGPLVDRWVDDRCLEHNSINMAWARECTALPCFKGVAWPQYAEQIILAEISGPATQYTGEIYPIIIHNWKGLCPKYMGNLGFPGGYGAEVGIYRWLSKRQIKDHYNERYLAKNTMWTDNSLAVAAQIRSSTNGAPDERWYPVPELEAKISFKLLDPQNANEVVIDSEERTKYINHSKHVTTRPYQDPADKFFWCTDWLTAESYERWAKSRPQYRGSGGFIDGLRLTLEWKIKGMRGDVISGRWTYDISDYACAPYPLFGCARNNTLLNMRKTTARKLDAPWPEIPLRPLSPTEPPPHRGPIGPVNPPPCELIGNCEPLVKPRPH